MESFYHIYWTFEVYQISFNQKILKRSCRKNIRKKFYIKNLKK